MQTSAMKACFQIAECSLSYAKIMLNREKTMENWEKVPIVVPKVAFLGTFGTTIELFANETYLSCVILTPIQYAIEFQRRRHRMK